MLTFKKHGMINFNDMVFKSNVQVIFECLLDCVTDISMPTDRLTSDFCYDTGGGGGGAMLTN